MTAFPGVEGLLNSRLLTYQTADSRGDVPLTPNHFFHGQPGENFAPKPLTQPSLVHASNGGEFRK